MQNSMQILGVVCYHLYLLKLGGGLGWVADLVGVSSYTPKGCRFDSLSEYIPTIPVMVCTGNNRSMFLSHINILSLFLPSSLFKINKHIFR